jgi:hypothetical protein
MDRDTLALNLHRAGNQWAVCAAMGDWAEVDRLAAEIEGYTRALDRIDYADPWDAMKGSPEHDGRVNG